MSALPPPSGRRPSIWVGILSVAVMLGAAIPVRAQVSTALVQGQVIDETRAVLPGVAITARNEETGLTRTTVTDERGYYRVSALPPGRYEVSAELTGFATIRKQGIPLTIGSEASIGFELHLVSVQETVTVTGESPLIETTKTTLGATITAKKLEDLPLAGRDYLKLVTLAAGVTTQGGAGGMASSGRNSGRAGYVVDGVSQDRNVFPSSRGSLSPDSVQEFQVLTNMFSAEYGQASGPIVNILTKSGTNDIHGRVGAFDRSNQLDARDYFAKGEAPFSQQWYVGSLGGPVLRDRMHYFGSFEGIKQDQTVVVTSPLQPGEYPQPFNQIKVLGKFDAQLRSANHATFRYSIDRNTTDNGGVGGLNTIERATHSFRKMQDYQGTMTTIISPRVLNELRVQSAFDYNVIDGKCALCPAVARPSGNFGKATNIPQWWDETRLQVLDHISLTKGGHNLKLGVNFNYIWTDIFFPNTRDGSFRFDTDKPFNAADAATYPAQYDIITGDPLLTIPDQLLALFVQDSWRVRSNLTVNAGLRYDWQGQHGVSGDKNNLGPRLSFNWDPTGKADFIVRGGGGIFYDVNRLELALFGLQSEKNFTQIRILNPGYPDPFGPNPNGTKDGSLPLPTLTVIEPNKRITYSERSSLGVVKALTRTLRLSADAVYVHGLKVLRNRDINYADPATGRRPNPKYGVISQQEASGQTVYYGLETELEQQFSRNVQFTLAYTISKSRNDVQDAPITQLDLREAMERTGNTHIINASGVYRLPWGLQLGGLLRARSGTFYSVLTGRDDNLDTFLSDRPAGESRNAHVGPWFFVVDGRISKLVQLPGSKRLELIAEAFNVTNRPSFSTPENRINSSKFMQFVTTDTNYNPRRVQLGARFTF
jgi:hypothetical protein